LIYFPTNGTALPVCSGEARQIVSSFPEPAIPVGVKAGHLFRRSGDLSCQVSEKTLRYFTRVPEECNVNLCLHKQENFRYWQYVFKL